MSFIPRVLIVEGIDRVGKGTFIETLYRNEGFRPTIKYGKPPKGFDPEAAKSYQAASMLSGFNVIRSVLFGGGTLIFDRFHLGETVYSPRYRGYDGSYVFGWEDSVVRSGRSSVRDIGLLLLYTDSPEDLVDDGDSVGPFDANRDEQKSFFKAYERSEIVRKVAVCTTVGGRFKKASDIYFEVDAAFATV